LSLLSKLPRGLLSFVGRVLRRRGLAGSRRYLLSAALILIASRADAFPEMIAHGYKSCKSCHVQPQGGGPLNGYGRGIAGDLLSTWGSAEEAETFYGYLDTSPFTLSGDFRYLIHRYQDERILLTQRFPMQSEVSLAYDPAENVTFLVSGGYYGFKPEAPETRRYLALASHGDLTLRVGRFLPAFGYEQADHTKAVKELFGQGKETINVEASYAHKYGELFLTRVIGSDARFVTSQSPKVVQKETSREGFIGKATAFVYKGFQVGGSAAWLEDGSTQRIYSGLHAFASYKKAYSLFEMQSHPNAEIKALGLIGYELIQGLHLKAELDHNAGENEIFATVDWFPRPHWEFLASASQKQIVFIIHHYL
jgi:hypothetical protein